MKQKMIIGGALFALLLALGGNASATSIYKCVSGGRVTYSGTPCRAASMREMQIKNAPQSKARDAQRARRHAEVAATTRKTRQALAAEERAKGKDGNAGTAGMARRCAMLQFEQKQVERKASNGTITAREQAQAAPLRNKIAVACRT